MKQIPIRLWPPCALAVLGVSTGLFLFFVLGSHAQAKPKKSRARLSSKPLAPKSSVEAPPALREGEKLDYTANFSKLSNVATIRLAVTEKRDFYGHSAWHLQAVAHTINPMRMVYELDDQFDSYSDAGNLAGLQYEMHLSERGQKQNAILRMTSRNAPAPSNATAAYVPEGTRDPLGLVAYLRTVNWQRQQDVSGPVYDGRNLYDVKARLISNSSAVTVPAGSYTTSRIEVRVYQGTVELKDTHFWLSVAHDQAHTPVLLEAETPIGVARLELSHAQ
ncbi:MAG TPA: DUF3108 domain-containing protein [Candidatus Dormibacteraeota bacterium]|nr:DUF3108 domain-containing protein [Candidatus Dormibacteraeota bacterium]